MKHILKIFSLSLLVLFAFLIAQSFGNAEYRIQNKPVKGIWLTNVASQALDSRENIRAAVKLCSESGINTIYVVTWNNGRTLYPSKLMELQFGIPIIEKFTGRDPLQEVIEEAHARNIKVHAWFEFGFSCSYHENGGMLLKKYPEWAALNNKGNLVKKNGFEWMNAFNPEVQNFITGLIKEVVIHYNIDGIQGDDRLPAVPSESGYDAYTVNLYQQQHNGANPPHDYKNPEWIEWRAGLLTQYLGNLTKDLKSIKPNLIISMAPSIHPWGKEEYLQDWPAWLAKGYIDYVIPQVYRYSFDEYRECLTQQVKLLKESEKSKFFSGILLQVDNYGPSDGLLDSMVVENRRQGISGECFFFFEGLKKHPEYFSKYNKE